MRVVVFCWAPGPWSATVAGKCFDMKCAGELAELGGECACKKHALDGEEAERQRHKAGIKFGVATAARAWIAEVLRKMRANGKSATPIKSQGEYLTVCLGFAERRGTHWVGYVEATRCWVLCAVGGLYGRQFVWEKRREILRGEGGRRCSYFTMGG